MQAQSTVRDAGRAMEESRLVQEINRLSEQIQELSKRRTEKIRRLRAIILVDSHAAHYPGEAGPFFADPPVEGEHT